MPSPLTAAAAGRRLGRLKMLAVAAICAAPVVASYLAFYVVKPTGQHTAYSDLITPPAAMPAVMAQPLAGPSLPLQSLRGQWLLVVVDGGACGAACEARLFAQRQLREMTGRERDRLDKLWLVVDDAPISPALRAALAATPAMHVLRVPRAAVAAWLKPAPGQQLEDHLYLVDPMAQWMARAPAQLDPTKLKRDIDRLMRASAWWDQPGRTVAEPAMPSQGPASGGAAPARPLSSAPVASSVVP